MTFCQTVLNISLISLWCWYSLCHTEFQLTNLKGLAPDLRNAATSRISFMLRPDKTCFCQEHDIGLLWNLGRRGKTIHWHTNKAATTCIQRINRCLGKTYLPKGKLVFRMDFCFLSQLFNCFFLKSVMVQFHSNHFYDSYFGFQKYVKDSNVTGETIKHVYGGILSCTDWNLVINDIVPIIP